MYCGPFQCAIVVRGRALRMNQVTLVSCLMYLEPVACVCALAMMYWRRQWAQFRPLALLLAVRVGFFCIGTCVIYIGRHHPLWERSVYYFYFYLYWFCYAIEAILGFFVISGVFSLAMAPLKGLERLGRLMFHWAGGVAIALALGTAFGPHITANTFLARAVTELQQTQSILTLCMLLFVCLAIRPMGLSHRSKIFGVCLGLGLIATSDLIGSAWLSHMKSLYSIYNILGGVSILLGISIWIGYFAIPEPKRRMIVLPTTSPFLRWNQISAALGDDPGYVVVGEFTPDMFAPAEVEIMRRATLKMRIPATS